MACSVKVSALALKIISTMSAGFYSGGCAAIAFCTQPAVLDLDDKTALLATKKMLARARPLPLSVILGTASSFGAYMLTRQTGKGDPAWLAGAIIFGATIPYTVLLFGPINGPISKDEVAEGDARPLLTKWLNYHWVRTFAIFGLFGFYTYTLAKKN